MPKKVVQDTLSKYSEIKNGQLVLDGKCNYFQYYFLQKKQIYIRTLRVSNIFSLHIVYCKLFLSISVHFYSETVKDILYSRYIWWSVFFLSLPYLQIFSQNEEMAIISIDFSWLCGLVYH